MAGTERTHLQTQPDHISELILKDLPVLLLNSSKLREKQLRKKKKNLSFEWTDHLKVQSVGFTGVYWLGCRLQPTEYNSSLSKHV